MTKTEETKKTDLTSKQFRNSEPVYERARPLVSPPLEITRSMLRLMNAVDENIILYPTTNDMRK